MLPHNSRKWYQVIYIIFKPKIIHKNMSFVWVSLALKVYLQNTKSIIFPVCTTRGIPGHLCALGSGSTEGHPTAAAIFVSLSQRGWPVAPSLMLLSTATRFNILNISSSDICYTNRVLTKNPVV